ncbi:ATP-binding protein [Commensalibacter sp. Nvir]|uniref:ATP-binding protein n=1 Tax=Commensalibacter sp. Nvir TaxID=3069817 RepID=UPI0038D118D1
MRRILLVNALPLVVLVATLLYLNQFQNSLLESEIHSLREQAKIYAGALGQSAIYKQGSLTTNCLRTDQDESEKSTDVYFLSINLAKPLLFSLTNPSPNVRAQVYSPNGQLIIDSRAETNSSTYFNHHYLSNSPTQYPKNALFRNVIENQINREATIHTRYDTVLEQVYTHLLSWMPYTGATKIQNLSINADSETLPIGYAEFLNSLHDKKKPAYIRRTADHHLLITITEPIFHHNQAIGVIQLTREAKSIDRALFSVRSSILILFLLALIITVLLSWYLSLTIARPLLGLAIAAHKMRETIGRTGTVPDNLLERKDEIGDLARVLQDSAKALWMRMDAIEGFAADVSHELKNPLSSIRSAIELLPRIEDKEHKKRLFNIVKEDVYRLDRLITDIASSSRIESEMSRLTPRAVAVKPIFQLLAEMHEATAKPEDIHIVVDLSKDVSNQPLQVLAIEDRLVQVLRNLIGNAISFSPPGGTITLSVEAVNDKVELKVSDEGPGIPPSKLDSIFERFYSERPQGENFGRHSGLGLSICRQIIKALKGNIRVYNIQDNDGHIKGACFVITLPRAL